MGDALFTPGWSDYRLRAYYNTFDVTGLIQTGTNAIGAVVAEGWYSGYVGYGLLVGYGPNRVGRYFYGKTPAVRLQPEVEYDDGSRAAIGTDPTWQTSGEGPICEADLIMGETYDARMEQPGWSQPGFAAAGWERAVRASEQGSCRAVFSDTTGEREVELGFVPPGRLQAYAGPPIRITEELAGKRLQGEIGRGFRRGGTWSVLVSALGGVHNSDRAESKDNSRGSRGWAGAGGGGGNGVAGEGACADLRRDGG